MRFSSTHTLAGAAAMLACCSASGIGAVGEVTNFSSKLRPDSSIAAVTAGSDGNLWFIETSYSDAQEEFGHRARVRTMRREHGGGAPTYVRVARVTPSGGVRYFRTGIAGFAAGITFFDGAVWITANPAAGGGTRLVRMSTSGEVTRTIPLGQLAGAIAAGQDDKLWMVSTVGGAPLLRVDPPTGAITVLGSAPATSTDEELASWAGSVWYPLGLTTNVGRAGMGGTASSESLGAGNVVVSVATGGDGALWFGLSGPPDALLRRTSSGDTRMPLPSGLAVWRGTGAADGTGWATTSTGEVARVGPGGLAQSFTAPPGTLITPGPDGNVWVMGTRPPGAPAGPPSLARLLTGVVPVNTVSPVLSGKVATGLTLTATAGAWKYLPSGYAYTWQRCKGADPSTCTDIGSARGATYSVTSDDLDRGIRVLVAAANLNGSSQGVASNIVSGDSPPSGAFTLGKITRKGYVITTRVTTPGPGSISQTGTIPGKKKARKGARTATAKPKPVKVCSPKAVAARGAGTYAIRCTLSKSARTMLAKKPLVVTLATAFTPTGGSRNAESRRVRVPVIPAKRR